MAQGNRWTAVIKIAAFVLIFALMTAGLNAYIAPEGWVTDKVSAYLDAPAPDVLVMGNSTVEYLSPLLMGEVSGLDVHQMATPMQTLQSSSFLLESLIERGEKPRTVLLYMHIRRLKRESTDFDKTLFQALPWSRAKWRMLREAFTIEEYPAALLRCVYGRELLFAAGSGELTCPPVPDALTEELAILTKHYGRGFDWRAELTSVQDPARIVIGNIDAFSVRSVKQSCVDALRRIARVCRDNDIELILFSLPILPGNLIATGEEGYHAFHEYVDSLAAELGVPFWDMTYVRPEQAVIDSSVFVDSRHGNAAFSVRMSTALGDMLRESRAGTLDAADYLYDDYETYLQLHGGINALYAADQPTGAQQTVNVHAALGADTAMELRVRAAGADGEFTVLRDWDTSLRVSFASLPAGEYRVLYEARQPGGGIEQTLEKIYTIE